MKATDQIAAVVWENAPFVVLAQVRGLAGDLLTLASVASVNVKVVAVGDTEPTSDDAIEPADCILPRVQRDWPWAAVMPYDLIGYNFRHTLNLANPGVYRVVYAITDTDGGVAVLDLSATVKDRP